MTIYGGDWFNARSPAAPSANGEGDHLLDKMAGMKDDQKFETDLRLGMLRLEILRAVWVIVSAYSI